MSWYGKRQTVNVPGLNDDGTFRSIREIPEMKRCDCGGTSALWMQERGELVCCFACAVRQRLVEPKMVPLCERSFARAT